jgi:putative ABC transport system ATP-binding protein
MLLETQQLTKVFNIGKPNEFTALHPVDIQIAAKTCTILQGASGCGKTTLLTILSCLAKPTAGEYSCMGEKVSRWSEKFLTEFRRKHIGIIFQHFNLIQGFTVAVNIALPLIPLRLSSKAIQEKVQKVAETVRIQHKLHEYVNNLSGGESQRVAIARALVNEPMLLLADEPTAHLDAANAQHILDTFSLLKNKGKTLIISTHDPLVLQQSNIDQIIRLNDGKLLKNENLKH